MFFDFEYSFKIGNFKIVYFSLYFLHINSHSMLTDQKKLDPLMLFNNHNPDFVRIIETFLKNGQNTSL